jgi:lipopolysaccharide transport system permease protein
MVFVRIPSDGQPYPLFAFSGLVVWQFFSRIVVDGTGSLVANSALITKVSFPRQIIPLVPPLAAVLDCLIAVMALIMIALAFGTHVHWTVIFVPAILLAVTFFGYSLVLWLAPLNAIYRDIGITVPFIMQVGMYLSPIVYPASLVPEKVRWLYQLNPVAAMVDSMRWAVLGSPPPSLGGLALFAGLSTLLFWGGGRFFRNVEGTLVDRI